MQITHWNERGECVHGEQTPPEFTPPPSTLSPTYTVTFPQPNQVVVHHLSDRKKAVHLASTAVLMNGDATTAVIAEHTISGAVHVGTVTR